MTRLSRRQLAAIALKAQGIYSYGHSMVIMPKRVKHLTPSVVRQRENFGQQVYNYTQNLKAIPLAKEGKKISPLEERKRFFEPGTFSEEEEKKALGLIKRRIHEHDEVKGNLKTPEQRTAQARGVLRRFSDSVQAQLALDRIAKEGYTKSELEMFRNRKKKGAPIYEHSLKKSITPVAYKEALFKRSKFSFLEELQNLDK